MSTAKLVYSAITSLDGYIADEAGNFDWAEPDSEVMAFINEVERPVGTYLYGRRMYETMVYWETFDLANEADEAVRDYTAIWLAADKVVYSRTLDAVSSARTRLERSFDAERVRQMKESAGHDLSVGGSDLAGQLLAAGLVDELHLFVTPVIVGGGTSAMPASLRVNLELLAMDRFAGGVVHLHYRLDG